MKKHFLAQFGPQKLKRGIFGKIWISPIWPKVFLECPRGTFQHVVYHSPGEFTQINISFQLGVNRNRAKVFNLGRNWKYVGNEGSYRKQWTILPFLLRSRRLVRRWSPVSVDQSRFSGIKPENNEALGWLNWNILKESFPDMTKALENQEFNMIMQLELFSPKGLNLRWEKEV